MTISLLHGYHIDVSTSPRDGDTGAEPSDGTATSPTLRIRRGPDRPVPTETDPDEVVSLLAYEDRTNRYAFFTDREGNLRLRFFDVAEIVADVGLERATAHLRPGLTPGLLDVLAAGMIVSTRLLLDGHLVLHASAVVVDGRAVAFCGASGMGKSTMAALGVAAGYGLLTDDVLRVDLDGAEPPLAWPGASELRLRETARELAVPADGSECPGRTADDRVRFHAPVAAPAPVPLSCVVVPHPDRELARVRLARLEPFEALRMLSTFPRLTGWREPSTLTTQFQGLAGLCERVPVVVARLPWGPPFDPSRFTELLDRLDDADAIDNVAR